VLTEQYIKHGCGRHWSLKITFPCPRMKFFHLVKCPWWLCDDDRPSLWQCCCRYPFTRLRTKQLLSWITARVRWTPTRLSWS